MFTSPSPSHLATACLLFLAACSDTTPIPVPPAVTTGLAPAVPLFASSTELLLASSGDAPGIYRSDLATGASELLVSGYVRHVAVGDQLLAVVSPDETQSLLARIPLDGSSPTTETLRFADTFAAVETGGYTFVAEGTDPSDTNIQQIRRLATETEPEQVLLAVNRGDYDSYTNSFYASEGSLYWVHINGIMRLAADGSESEATWLDSAGDWSAFDLRGYTENTERWVLGVQGGALFALRNDETFVETGGSWSNGDPKGTTGFGGGALYTVAADDEAQGRLVRGDIQTAVLAGDAIYAQTIEGVVERIDPNTGEGTPIATQTPHGLLGNGRMVVNDRAVYYGSGEIHELMIDPPAAGE